MLKALAISDTHVGHVLSIMSKKVEEETMTGIPHVHKPNKAQRVLFKEWKKMCDNGPYDVVFFLGDGTEGSNYADKGYGNWTSNLSLQAETNAELLSMIPSKEFFYVQGSGYHIEKNLTTERHSANLLREKVDVPVHYGVELIAELEDNGEEWNIHLSHKTTVSKSTWQYRTTPIAREMVLAQMNRHEVGKIDGLIRGHAHYYTKVEFENSFGFICPCWKIRDSFAALLGFSTVARLGWVQMEFDGKKKRFHIDPYSIKLNIKKTPYMKRIKAGEKNVK